MWFFFLPLSPQVQGWREHIQKKAFLLSARSGFHHLSHNFISCQSLKPLSRRHLSLLCSALPKATVRRGFQNLPSFDLPSQGTTSASSAPSHSHLGHLPLESPRAPASFPPLHAPCSPPPDSCLPTFVLTQHVFPNYPCSAAGPS